MVLLGHNVSVTYVNAIVSIMEMEVCLSQFTWPIFAKLSFIAIFRMLLFNTQGLFTMHPFMVLSVPHV
jgi:hypothetical protein